VELETTSVIARLEPGLGKMYSSTKSVHDILYTEVKPEVALSHMWYYERQCMFSAGTIVFKYK